MNPVGVWSCDAGERNSDKCIHIERRVSLSQCTLWSVVVLF